MPYMDDDSSTLTAAAWQEIAHQRPAAPEAPRHPQSWVARFFNTLAASMALQQRQPWSPYRDNHIVLPSEMLAQRYPYIYLQMMCG